MTQQTEREAFESHFIERHPRWKKKRGDGGDYINIKASIAWEAWQARARLGKGAAKPVEVGEDEAVEVMAKEYINANGPTHIDDMRAAYRALVARGLVGV